MFSISDIHTVSEFNRKSGEYIERLRETKRPEILTQNGKPALVIQDATAYEEMAQMADYADSIMHIRKALREFAEGKGHPAEERLVLLEKRISARYGDKAV